MTRIVHIVGNAGSGKSVLALNLSVALNQKSTDVILVDGNLYSPDINHYSDISPTFYLNEVLEGSQPISRVITSHASGLRVIASTMEREHKREHYDQMNSALLQLMGKSEIVLVDSFSHSPALVGAIHPRDEAIFVTNDDFAGIVKSKEFIESLQSKGVQVIGVVLNKRGKTDKKSVEAILQKRVLAEISHDPKLVDSVNKKQPVYLTHPRSSMAIAAADLAQLLGTKK